MAGERPAPRRKSQVGTVVSDRMQKTVVVAVERMKRHRLYQKTIRRSKRYLAHDDRLEARVGDLVRIVETRPLSRHKRWRVAEILQRSEEVEVAPREIDAEYLGRPRQRPEPEAVEAPATAEAQAPEEAQAAAPAEAVGAEAAAAEEREEAPAEAAVTEESPESAPATPESTLTEQGVAEPDEEAKPETEEEQQEG